MYQFGPIPMNRCTCNILIITQPTITELLSIFDCLVTFPSLPVRYGFEELFPMTVSLSHDTVAQSDDALNTDNVKRIS